MDMTWWTIRIECPQCQGETALQSVDYSSDGEWRFCFWCAKCKNPIVWRVFQSQLAAQAQARDFEKWTAKQNTQKLDRAIGKEIARIAGPVQPPLEPKLNLTRQDIRDLKALKILPPENEPPERPSGGGVIH